MDPIERAAKIKSDLFTLGYSLADVDREYGLAKRSTADALRNPNRPAEKAIADALGVKPHELFPERYNKAGRRLTPQSRVNYRRPSTMAQRRNGEAA